MKTSRETSDEFSRLLHPVVPYLGTAGALRNIAAVFDRPMWVVYGDSLVRLDLSALARTHIEALRGPHPLEADDEPVSDAALTAFAQAAKAQGPPN